jgi:peptidoglycan/xylan/chitin deacetylase (PgdA/CDA1 family)
MRAYRLLLVVLACGIVHAQKVNPSPRGQMFGEKASGAAAKLASRSTLQVFQDCKKPGHIALTFDDGPSNNTALFLRTLREEKAVATFFLLGKAIRRHILDVKQVR